MDDKSRATAPRDNGQPTAGDQVHIVCRSSPQCQQDHQPQYGYRRSCARDAAGLRPLRLHDLRHTYGSLLAAAGVDLVTIQAAMGHSALTTTSIYLHARPASEQAQVFTRAFESRPTSLEDVPQPSAPVATVDP